MDRKSTFNGKAANDSGLIIPSVGAEFQQILSDIKAGKGPSEIPPTHLEALLAQPQKPRETTASGIEIVRTTIISRAVQLPLQPGKIEVAHEIPANLQRAFTTAMNKGTLSTAEIIMTGGGAAADKKPAAKGIILPTQQLSSANSPDLI